MSLAPPPPLGSSRPRSPRAGSCRRAEPRSSRGESPIAWLTLTGSLFVVLSVGCAQAIAAAGDLWIDYGFYHDLGARWLVRWNVLPAAPARRAIPAVTDDRCALPAVRAPSLRPVLDRPADPVVGDPDRRDVVRGPRLATLDPCGRCRAVAARLARATGAFLYGNTDMWAMAAVAAGLRWGWPAAFVVLKPSLAPLALVGIAHRSWWVGVLAFVVLVPATMALWWDYVVVLTNVRGLGSGYRLGQRPAVVGPGRSVGGQASAARASHRVSPDSTGTGPYPRTDLHRRLGPPVDLADVALSGTRSILRYRLGIVSVGVAGVSAMPAAEAVVLVAQIAADDHDDRGTAPGRRRC